MAEVKITELTADTGPTKDDLVLTVNSPGGTPGSKKVTIEDFLEAINDLTAMASGGVADGDFVLLYDLTASAVRKVSAGIMRRTVYIQLEPFGMAQSTDWAIGDGNAYTIIPAELDGWNLVSIVGVCRTAGTTGTGDLQVNNVTQAADMLSTKLTIDSGETTSATAATAAVIDTANDDVASGDVLRIDCDAKHTTAAKGGLVMLGFQRP